MDETVNILTVMANESYETYASNLQNKYREAGYDKVPPRVSRADDGTVKHNQRVFDDKNFREFWRELTRKNSHRIHVDSESLVREENVLKEFTKLTSER